MEDNNMSDILTNPTQVKIHYYGYPLIEFKPHAMDIAEVKSLSPDISDIGLRLYNIDIPFNPDTWSHIYDYIDQGFILVELIDAEHDKIINRYNLKSASVEKENDKDMYICMELYAYICR